MMLDDDTEVKSRAFENQTRDMHRIKDHLSVNNPVAPMEKMIKDHLFILKITCNDKRLANKEAKKYHKQGYHTRVIETSPGYFSVYRRNQPTTVTRPGRKFIPPPPPA
jgi:hypothetical protein